MLDEVFLVLTYIRIVCSDWVEGSAAQCSLLRLFFNPLVVEAITSLGSHFHRFTSLFEKKLSLEACLALRAKASDVC